MSNTHWTDTATSPVFGTVIQTRGPAGNIFMILGTAAKMLRQLDVPEDRVRKLTDDVYASDSYEAAIRHVERWFPVER